MGERTFVGLSIVVVLAQAVDVAAPVIAHGQANPSSLHLSAVALFFEDRKKMKRNTIIEINREKISEKLNVRDGTGAAAGRGRRAAGGRLCARCPARDAYRLLVRCALLMD
jgi:hypothetical protein